jgi:hypothetical protein
VPRILSRALTLTAGALLALGPGPAVASPGAPPYCGQVWGSLPEGAGPAVAATAAGTQVTDVRTGRHACFDRLVVDLRGPATAPGYSVRYVDTVHAPGSGAPVVLRGGATLEIVVAAPAYDGAGQPTWLPADRAEAVDVGFHDTFRQVAWAGSYEGRTTLGLGVRARLPFRTFVLTGDPGSDRAARLVVDVGHRW